jgi:hypothetical protein
VVLATRHLEARTQLSLHPKSSSSGTDKPTSVAPAPLRSSKIRTRRSGSPNGYKSTAFTTLKIAVVAPRPRAIVNTAMAMKPGDLRSVPRSVASITPEIVPRKPAAGFVEPFFRLHDVEQNVFQQATTGSFPQRLRPLNKVVRLGL